MKKILLVIFISSLLYGCQQSPRKNYFLLDSPTVTTSASENITSLIGIGPITLAEYLHRLQVVYQADDGKLIMADNDYWAEPLDNGIARAIALNLTQRDSSRGFIHFPWRADTRPAYSFRVHVHSLSRQNNSAHINATWELIDNSNKVALVRRHFIRSAPTASGSGALIQAYSKMIAELAAEMDGVLPRERGQQE